jgi:cysteine desulfurase
MHREQPIYLDFAAATPLDKSVLAAMQPYLADKFYNPSAIYLAAKRVRDDLESARRDTAQLIGARPAEIIFTAGGTEANNLAIRGVMNRFPDSQIIVSAVEHESVIVPAQCYNHKFAQVDSSGRVDLVALADAITEKTVMVSIMYANNEIGTVQPIRQIADAINQVRLKRRKTANRLPLYLHTDATQAANYLDLHIARLGVSLITLNGGKIYGPKQSGALFVAKDVELESLIIGGGQERGLRSGTENMAAVIGFAAALSIAQTARRGETARLEKLQQHFFQLLTEHFPDVTINGNQKHRLPNNVHVTFSGIDNERLLIELDRSGVLAAAGSACSASSSSPSHVLRAIGLSDEQARSSVRFTMGRSTTSSQINQTVRALAGLVK